MPIIGFGFDKISAERKSAEIKDNKLQNGVKITSLKESKIKIGNEEKSALNLSFEFIVDYQAQGKVELLGHLLYYDTPENIKTLIDLWNKDNKLPTAFGTRVYNYIFNKTHVKAMQLEEEVNLPFHLRLPTLKIKKKQ